MPSLSSIARTFTHLICLHLFVLLRGSLPAYNARWCFFAANLCCICLSIRFTCTNRWSLIIIIIHQNEEKTITNHSPNQFSRIRVSIFIAFQITFSITDWIKNVWPDANVKCCFHQMRKSERLDKTRDERRDEKREGETQSEEEVRCGSNGIVSRNTNWLRALSLYRSRSNCCIRTVFFPLSFTSIFEKVAADRALVWHTIHRHDVRASIFSVDIFHLSLNLRAYTVDWLAAKQIGCNVCTAQFRIRINMNNIASHRLHRLTHT